MAGGQTVAVGRAGGYPVAGGRQRFGAPDVPAVRVLAEGRHGPGEQGRRGCPSPVQRAAGLPAGLSLPASKPADEQPPGRRGTGQVGLQNHAQTSGRHQRDGGPFPVAQHDQGSYRVSARRAVAQPPRARPPVVQGDRDQPHYQPSGGRCHPGQQESHPLRPPPDCTAVREGRPVHARPGALHRAPGYQAVRSQHPRDRAPGPDRVLRDPPGRVGAGVPEGAPEHQHSGQPAAGGADRPGVHGADGHRQDH